MSDQEPLAEVTCPACATLNPVAGSIGPFELLEVVGQGGMGVVYKARDAGLDRLVALKLLRRDTSTDAEQIEKLASEAAITASINHPHVVKVFTTGTDRGRFYLAMELVDKGTLDDLISLQGRVAEAQVLDVGIQIAQGLRAAQHAGLIHRDVKPGNILFADAHTAKIVDFGLALFMAEAAAASGDVWGTPYYVAPEKLDKKPEDFRSDMYSLGATLFHALAGRPPFEAEDASMVALKHLKSQAVSLQAFAPWVSGPTSFVINRTLLKSPDDRYQSYDELIEHLEYARAELDKMGAQPPASQRVVLENAQQQKALGWVTVAGLGLIALLIAGFFFLRGKGEPPGAAHAEYSGATGDTKYDRRYHDARKLLLGGHASDAATAFARLGEDKLPQPMLNWTNFHEGLARFAAGDMDPGIDAFRRIAERGPYLSAPADAPLAKFFVETAKLAAGLEAVPASAAKTIDKSGDQALALIVFGLKNWQIDAFDDAGELLREYDRARAAAEKTRLPEYQPLVADHLNDYGAYREAVEAGKQARTVGGKAPALKALDDLRASMKLGGKLATKIDALRKTVAAMPAVLPPPKPVRKLAPGLPWSFADLGNTGPAGDARLNAARDVFTVRGSGGDVWGGADECHFVWQQLTGDGEIVARVASVSATDPWSKAGVMLREKLAPEARNVFAAVSAKNGAVSQRRRIAAQQTTNEKFPHVAAPQWLKLAREGDRIATFHSTDGVAWTPLSSDTLPKLAPIVFLGLAVTAHNNAELCTAVFDNVKVGAP